MAIHKALLIVDVQNDFLPTGMLPVPCGDAVIPVINTLQKEFSCVIASMDYHPLHHESFAVQHPNKQVGDIIDLHGLKQILWPVHAVQGSQGASFAAELDITRIQHVIRKGTNPQIDSYSAFSDNGKRQNTGLSALLRSLSVDTIYICGLATDYCVLYTALDAQAEGFQTYVYVDATRGVNSMPDDSEYALQQMQASGIILL